VSPDNIISKYFSIDKNTSEQYFSDKAIKDECPADKFPKIKR
jgi:hypothetical protein